VLIYYAYKLIYYVYCSRRTEFLQVFIPVLKSLNGHLGSSDVDLGRKTERCLFTLGYLLILVLITSYKQYSRIER